MTTLLSMTVSASVVIAVIIVIRSLFVHRLPKRLFVILWTAAALRMLVPFSISVNIPHENTQPENVVVREFAPSEPPESTSGTSGAPNRDLIFGIVWAGGVVISLGIMTALHLSSRRELSEALPTDDTEIQSHISAEKFRRKITVKVSDKVTSPLTYGIVNPVIILPKDLPADSEEMRFALAHELVHIRRFDVLMKLVFTAAACVHWFNPLAWAMFALANQNIELSCDEAVLKRLGCKREDYAMALIRLEEKRSISAGAAFGRNAVRERIEVIMKFKKTTLAGIIVSACLIAGTTTAFAAVNSDGYTREEVPAETETADVTDLDSNEYADVEWWTYDEYKAWLEQEKKNIAELVKQGAAGWTQSSGDFIWTQDIADETIALYEQNLEDIKNGAHISKPVNGSYDDIVYSYYQVEDGADVHLSTDESYQTTAEEDGTVYISDDTTDAYTTIEHYISDEELYSKYEKYGLTYRGGRLYYNGEAVKYFDDTVAVDDTITEIIAYLDSDGTVALTAEREGSDSGLGELTGIRVVPEEEYITVNTGFVS